MQGDILENQGHLNMDWVLDNTKEWLLILQNVIIM